MEGSSGTDPLVIRRLEFMGGMATAGGWRPEPSLPEVAFAGRSNVYGRLVPTSVRPSLCFWNRPAPKYQMRSRHTGPPTVNSCVGTILSTRSSRRAGSAAMAACSNGVSVRQRSLYNVSR